MLGQEASEFVEPKRAVDAGRWGGYDDGCFVCEGHRCCRVGCRTRVLLVKSFDVLLQLEGGVELLCLY